MHVEIAPYLLLGSFIVASIFNVIQCNVCKIEDVKDYSKRANFYFGYLLQPWSIRFSQPSQGS